MARKHFSAVIKTPLGKVGVLLDEGIVIGLDYLGRGTKLRRSENPVAARAVRELRSYFINPFRRFTLPVEMNGTVFQCKVWHALLDIPAGKTLTYGELADQLGSGAQAVGNACRANPIPIVVPCHRVVAAKGLGGYAGAVKGPVLERKRWLLEHEGALRAIGLSKSP